MVRKLKQSDIRKVVVHAIVQTTDEARNRKFGTLGARVRVVIMQERDGGAK